MSRLLIDIGNSRINWLWQPSDRDATRVVKGDFLHAGQTLSAMQDAITAQWQALSDDIAQRQDGLASAWLSCVGAKSHIEAISAIVQQLWGIKPNYARSQATLAGVTSGYDDPAQLGIDRWLVLLAARALHPNQHCVIIDAGSAVTLDALRANGQHLGGAIFPGLHLQQQALNISTANLDALSKQVIKRSKQSANSSEDKHKSFGSNTKAAIALGITAAVAGGVTLLRERMAAEFKGSANFHVVSLITGGDASMILEHDAAAAKIKFDHQPDLVLIGLAVYANAHESE